MLCVPHAAPCGHFASLVRSIAAQSARLPSVSLRRISRQSSDCLRVRPLRLSPSAPRPLSCGRVLRHRCTSARFVAARRLAPRGALRPLRALRSARGFPPLRSGAFPRNRLSSRARHPSAGYGAMRLVGIPPVAPALASSAPAAHGRRIALWPRSPSPLRLRANRTCCSLRVASVAACTAYLRHICAMLDSGTSKTCIARLVVLMRGLCPRSHTLARLGCAATDRAQRAFASGTVYLKNMSR